MDSVQFATTGLEPAASPCSPSTQESAKPWYPAVDHSLDEAPDGAVVLQDFKAEMAAADEEERAEMLRAEAAEAALAVARRELEQV